MKFIGNTQEDFDKIQVLKTYDDLRAYRGLATQAFISDVSGIGGLFVYDPSDTTSSDDSETVMVAGSKRWKRVYSDTPYPALAGGTVNDISATLKTNISSLPSILECTIISSGMNTGAATLTVTLGSNVQTTFPIVKFGNIPLDSGDIPSAGYPIKLIYVDALGVYLMVNPSVSTTAITQNQFDSSTKISNTEFVQRALGNNNKTLVFASATTIGPECFGSVVTLSGDSYTITLTGAVDGGRIEFVNTTNFPKTIESSPEYPIFSLYNSSAASIVVNPMSALTLVGSQSFWRMVSYSESPALGVGQQWVTTSADYLYSTEYDVPGANGRSTFVSIHCYPPPAQFEGRISFALVVTNAGGDCVVDRKNLDVGTDVATYYTAWTTLQAVVPPGSKFKVLSSQHDSTDTYFMAHLS